LQFSSFKTSIIGSVIGGAALIATGNIALSGAIFSATFLVSLGQKFIGYRKNEASRRNFKFSAVSGISRSCCE